MGLPGGSEKNPEMALVNFLLKAGDRISSKRVKEIADLVAEHGDNARTVLGDAGSTESGGNTGERDRDAELMRKRDYKPSDELCRVIDSFIHEPNFHIDRDIAKRMVRFSSTIKRP